MKLIIYWYKIVTLLDTHLLKLFKEILFLIILIYGVME